ncbi:MAG: C45 family autoproteolytic acyltransferase/hydrolase [Deltaproteobacteria bacterium]
MIAVAKETAPRAAKPVLERVEGINILRVRGNFYEMGYQHGEALAEQIARGPVPYFKKYLERAVAGPLRGAWSPVAWALVRQLLAKRVEKKLPTFARQTLEGLADGANLKLESLIDGDTMPDSFLWVASRMMQLQQPGPAVAHRLMLGLGCTSAIAWGDATTDGRLLHARNFDFYGVTPWPAETTVIFAEPERGQRYVSVASAGVPLGGVTAMNEAGLTITVHQHLFTDQTRFGGIPTGLVGDIVMREAENLDDAEKILKEHTPIGCWTYVVTDGERKEVLCLEENPNRKAVRRTKAEDNTFGYANVYLDEALGATEVNLYPSYWRHNSNRHRRANELLEQREGPLSPESMASILADHGGIDCRISGAIGMLMTVGSVVFSPTDRTLWVATGEAPTSIGTYVPFSLTEADHHPAAGTLTTSSDDTPAFEAYRDAYLAYFDEEDAAASRTQVKKGLTHQPEETLYHALDGFLALDLGDANGAHAAFDRALELGHPHAERIATFYLWRGRASDVLGRRDAAERDYRQCLARVGDPNVHAAAKKNLKKPYAKKKKLTIDFVYADVMAP